MPARWVTETIETFLTEHVPAFKKAQQTSTVSNDFMPMILREFLKAFPIPSPPADASPEARQIYNQTYSATVLKREKQLYSWYYNNHSSTNVSSPVNALANLVAPLNKEKTKKKRALTSVQVFSKEFYDSEVKPLVEKELENMRENSEGRKLSRGAHLPVIARLTNEAWEGASESVKAEVEKKRLELLEENEEDDTVDEDDVIDQLPAIVEQFIKSIRQLDWTVSVFIGGMNRRQGQVTTSAFHAGENRAGLSFDESLSDYKERITDPFSAFVKDFYRGLKSQSPQAPIPTQSSEAEPASPTVPLPAPSPYPQQVPSPEPTRAKKAKKAKKARSANEPADRPANPPVYSLPNPPANSPMDPPIDPSLLQPISPPPQTASPILPPQLHLQPYNSGPSEPMPMTPVDTSVTGNKRHQPNSSSGQAQKRRRTGTTQDTEAGISNPPGRPKGKKQKPNVNEENTVGIRKSGRTRQAPKRDTTEFIGAAERVRRVTEDTADAL
ncbi:hypothetical protein VKT23_016164 [Stygiomarasmius scandens]|uniref:Uncharacterized protein n=1 Tax=Marasmiellus scandens TaxID=2682957 RepID=A0ABR1IYU1_9AGAR